MEERINKPRVFLSLSESDLPFVERVKADFERCQIQCWIYTRDLRHGRSWQQMIFGEGIPTCDSFLVYISQDALDSKVVEKEIDAGLIRQLHEEGVAFLPYLKDASLRPKLRSDIESLQCPEWNEDNYSDLLPAVVAEVWRSFSERAIGQATLAERNSRLEAELELERLSKSIDDSIFSAREENEFSTIRDRLSGPARASIAVLGRTGEGEPLARLGLDVVEFSPLGLTTFLFDREVFTFDTYSIRGPLKKLARETLTPNRPDFRGALEYGTASDVSLIPNLAAMGLIHPIQVPFGDTKGNSSVTKFQFTEKMQRLRYWLDCSNIYPEPQLTVVASTAENPAGQMRATVVRKA